MLSALVLASVLNMGYSPSLVVRLPNYTGSVEVTASKGNAKEAKQIYSGPVYKGQGKGFSCYGTSITSAGLAIDCAIPKANPNYVYIIKLTDEFGDRIGSIGCSHTDEGWTCLD